MASLSVIFKAQDEISAKFEEMAQSGERALSAFESAGSAADDAISRASTTATQTAQSFSSAATATDHWTSAVGGYNKEAMEAIYSTEELVQMGFKTEDALSDAAAAADEAADGMENLGDESENGSERTVNAMQSIAGALAAAGITKLVAEIGEAFMAASEAAAEFETATMKISTVADTAKVPLSTISADLLNLSSTTGQSVLELSDAAYSALSASVDTASAVEFTGTATKLAAGGFTSSATAVDVLTTAINAYGLEASDAASISDMLITTQNLGKTTVDQLATSVGKVIPLASAYGVKMDNLSAAYAELTKGGIATAESTTYLKGMLTELGDSGSTVSGILMEETGQSFAQLMDSGYSLGDVLDILGDSVGGNATEFSNLWSSTEAGIGALALFNAGADQFNTTLDAMQNSVGATDRAYETMTGTTAHAQEALSNAASNLQIAVGQNINPLMEKLYNTGTKILNFMTSFVQEHPNVTKAIIAIGTGIAAVAVGLGGVAAAAGIYNGVMALSEAVTAAFGVTLSAAIWPITAIAAGIAAVTAAALFLVDAFEEDLGETEGMTAATRNQYYAMQDLQAQYDAAVEKYGATSEEASRLKYQLDDLSASFEKNKQTVEQFTAQCDTLAQSVTTLKDDFNTSIGEIDNNEASTFALIQKYEDLATQTDLTAAEQEALKAVTESLSQTFPDLADVINDTTGSAEDYAEAMRQACEQQADMQRQEQTRQTYVEALNKRKELTDQIAAAQENIRLEQERMDNMSGWTHFWTGGEWDDLEAYQKALDELQAAERDNEALIAGIEEGWQEAYEAEQETADGAMTAEEAVSQAWEGVKDRVMELCAAYDAAYEAALSSFEGQFGLFDTAEADMEATVENAQAALDSQLAYWDNYAANLATLKGTSADDLGITQENYDALMALVQDGSAEAAGLAESMVDAINSGNTDAVAELANTVGEVSSKQSEIAAMTADWQTNFTAEMDAIEAEMKSTVEDMDLSDEAAASATSTISSYADSIRAGQGEAVAAAEQVANAVTQALEAAKPVVRVQVQTAGSVAGAATGTTNAPDVLLVGEKGPELVARRTARYANGTTDSSDFFIAGDDGPELIIGEKGSTVFPTSETDRLISALNSRSETVGPDEGRAAVYGLGGGAGGTDTGTGERHITLEINGKGNIQVDGGGANKDAIIEVLYEYLKPVLSEILTQEAFEEGDGSYGY